VKDLFWKTLYAWRDFLLGLFVGASFWLGESLLWTPLALLLVLVLWSHIREVELLKKKCGAQSWAYDDDGTVILYGTCQLPKDHEESFHLEVRGGEVWAEWSGPATYRIPEGIPLSTRFNQDV
jgi:hypothetical protein